MRTAAVVTLLGLATLAPTASAERPKLKVTPMGLEGGSFKMRQHDYVARCQPRRTKLKVVARDGWHARVGGGRFRSGRIVRAMPAAAGKRVRVSLRRGRGQRKRYHVRCLPRDFPEYSFSRTGPGGPRFFFTQVGAHYAAAFDRRGVPMWWFKASGEPDNVQLLRDGTIAFDPVDDITWQTGDYEIRTLSGRLLRVVRGANGHKADIHEILLLPNGNYVIGAQEVYGGVDATPYGGAADATAVGIQIQEISPQGELVSSWSSKDHIDVSETPQRWWDHRLLDDEPYDVVHWNSVERYGRYMLLSFRHLDAVYKVDRRTGEIVWKLGGTQTPESLEVLNDPFGDYAFGGQHDARIRPNGTVTVYDNRTNLDEPPRAVRYRIDEEAGTATLVETIADPEATNSVCCGSARQLPRGDWLVAWGGTGLTGAYSRGGSRVFALELASGFTYRANPVTPYDALSRAQLRTAMDRVQRRGDAR